MSNNSFSTLIAPTVVPFGADLRPLDDWDEASHRDEILYLLTKRN